VRPPITLTPTLSRAFRTIDTPGGLLTSNTSAVYLAHEASGPGIQGASQRRSVRPLRVRRNGAPRSVPPWAHRGAQPASLTLGLITALGSGGVGVRRRPANGSASPLRSLACPVDKGLTQKYPDGYYWPS